MLYNMKSSLLFFIGGIAATFAVCALARCPKTRELWEKGLDKGKQAKQKAMDALGHIKNETADWYSDTKEKLAGKFSDVKEQAADME